MPSITSVSTQDVRFPTSLELDGSDAVNVDPGYSAAYVVIRTDVGDEGHGFVFTCGRGNEILTAAIDAYARLLVGRDIEELIYDLVGASKRLIHDSQIREREFSQLLRRVLVIVATPPDNRELQHHGITIEK
jgi:L-fuconate dehydratase